MMKPRLKMIPYSREPFGRRARDLGYLWFCVGGGCSAIAFTPEAAYAGWRNSYTRRKA